MPRERSASMRRRGSRASATRARPTPGEPASHGSWLRRWVRPSIAVPAGNPSTGDLYVLDIRRISWCACFFLPVDGGPARFLALKISALILENGGRSGFAAPLRVGTRRLAPLWWLPHFSRNQAELGARASRSLIYTTTDCCVFGDSSWGFFVLLAFFKASALRSWAYFVLHYFTRLSLSRRRRVRWSVHIGGILISRCVGCGSSLCLVRVCMYVC